MLSVFFIIYIFGPEHQLNSYLTSCYLEAYIFCGNPEVIKKKTKTVAIPKESSVEV